MPFSHPPIRVAYRPRSAITATLSNIDLMTLIARFARTPVPLLALAQVATHTRPTALAVLDHLLSIRGFLARYFVDNPDIFQDELARGEIIFTGLPLFLHLARFQRSTYPLTAVSIESSAAEVARKLRSIGFRQANETRFYVATCPSVGPHANPYSRIMAFLHHDGSQVWVLVSPYSCLHGVLSQRHSLLLNGLTGDGYFSLYPMAGIVARHSVLLQADTRAEDQQYVFRLARLGIHLTLGPLPYSSHHTLRSGARRFGDKFTWLFTPGRLLSPDAFTELSLNTWSLSQRYSWRYSRDSPMELRFISVRLLNHHLLTRTYLATSFSKTFILRCLDLAAQHEEPLNYNSHHPITNWDGELGVILTKFQAGLPYVFVTASPHTDHATALQLNNLAAIMQRPSPSS